MNNSIKYFLLIILITFTGICATPIKLGRLHYDGGGDWYNDPDMLPNLADYANQELGMDIVADQGVVKPSERKLADYPFLFMTGHGNIKFTDKELEMMREYLLNGGFLYADDDYGMDQSFRKEIERIFPEKELVELPSNHEIYNCYFNFKDGLPKIHEHDNKRPQGFAIFDDYGRMLVFYTYESNISDGWAGPQVHDDPPAVREKALKMGVNLLYYIITK